MRRLLRPFNRNVVITLFVLVMALVVYFMSIQSQGEVVSIAIGQFGDKNIAVAPAQYDGAVAWMEAVFVTEVPTHTPPPSLTPTLDLTRTATPTPKPTKTPTITGTLPTRTPKKTKAPTVTETPTTPPLLTPTTHAYFVGYRGPISTFNTYGSSISAAPLSVGGRLYLVIADGTHGLNLVDVTDPNNPIQTRYTIKEANAVKVVGTTAYVAAGEDGVIILDLTNPRRPVAVDKRDTIGPALDLDVYFRLVRAIDGPTGRPIQYTVTRIYVAMGRDGVQVLSIFPIAKQPPRLNKGKKEMWGKDYGKAIHYKTEDNVLAVSEANQFGKDEYVFIADGKDGVKVLNLFNVDNRPIRDSDVVHSFDIAYAWDVAFGYLVEHRARQDRQFYWLFVAAGKQGVLAYKVINDKDLSTATYRHFKTINTPGEARAVTLFHNNLFVGDGEGGVQVIDFNDPDNPVLLGNARYEFDWKSVPIFYALKEWLIRNVQSPGSIATLGNVGIDAVLCVVSLAVVAFLLTGVVLPVRTISDRLRTLQRVVANWFGLHGPAWVIEDGRPRHRTHWARPHGVGVTLQDANSAAAFDEHRGYPRLSGDQVTFTDRDEHLVWVVELRRRQLVIGPRQDDLDPFVSKGDNEERADYRARQHRRRVTAGRTADDVEVVASLRVVYSLEGATVSEQDEFGYDMDAVESMYNVNRTYPLERHDRAFKYWKQRQSIQTLLERMVSQVWKLSLKKVRLEELFPPPNFPAVEQAALQKIQQKLHDLLVEREEGELSEFAAEEIKDLREGLRILRGGRREASQDASTEEPIRGVRVHEVKLEGLYLSDDDTQRLLQQWIEDWRAGNPPPIVESQDRAEREKVIQFAEYAVTHFKARGGVATQPKRQIEALVALLKGTLRALPVGSDEHRRLSAAIRQLEGITE